MKLRSYFNPFNLLRWTFYGKRLDEIVDFDEKRAELDDFFARTESLRQHKEAQIKYLAAQNAVHTDHMDKAKLLSDNLLILTTQALGKTAETEATTDGEAA
jgi:hypothetical protein